MATTSSDHDGDVDVPLEELIFSCSICSATVSDVYKTVESNKGFHSGSGDSDGVVTRMWIAECSHVTCSKHLDGGAVPFHPQGAQPTAPCPWCVMTSSDKSPKALFAIRGLGVGEYDTMIPKEWTKCPAIKLDSSIPGMEAVRFQYMALVNYGRKVRQSSQSALRKLQAMEIAFAKERKQRRQLQSNMLEAQARLERLQEIGSKLKKWEDRKPAIYHCLGAFGEMTREIEDSRTLLRRLGYQVADKSYALPDDKAAYLVNANEKQDAAPAHAQSNLSSTITAVARETEGSSSARKRKREIDAYDERDVTGRGHGNSRELMPPPLPRARPVSRPQYSPKTTAENRRPPLTWRKPSAVHQSHQEELLYRPPPTVTRLSRFDGAPPIQHLNKMQDQRYQQGNFWSNYSHNEQGYIERRKPSYQYTSNPSVLAPPLDIFSNINKDEVYEPRNFNIHSFHGNFRAYDHSEGLPVFDQNNSSHPRFQQSAAYATPERQRLHEPTVPQRSHFFSAGPTIARPETLRPMRLEPRSDVADWQQMRPAYRPIEEPSSRVLIRADENVDYRQPIKHYRESLQQASAQPQTSRRLPPFLRQPDRGALSSGYGGRRPPHTNAVRSRVSLPPRTMRAMPLNGQPDGALSGIQGVRGLGSQRGRPTPYAPPSAYEARQQFVSAIGSRRSVSR